MILDHPSKFPFLFVEFGVVFLLLSQLGSGLKKSLEVLLVALALKQVDFCEQLVLLLLKLIDLLLQLARVHTLVPHMINILMGRLELSLQILVHLESLPHFFVSVKKLVRDLERHQKLGGVSPPLKFWHLGDEPVQQMLNGLLLSVDYIPLERWVEITGVSEHLDEATDPLLGLILSFALDIDRQVLLVELSQNPI